MKFGLKTNESGVYMIKNIENGKMYVGSAVQISKRISTHFHLLDKNKHHSAHLQNAWNQTKGRGFVCGVIEFVNDVTQLKQVEQRYINIYKCSDGQFGYNILSQANNTIGYKHTHNALKKISESNIQKKLTSDNINEIKFLSDYGVSQRTIGKIFNVSQPHISKIINNLRRFNNYMPCQDLQENA